jgi:spore germination protein KB
MDIAKITSHQLRSLTALFSCGTSIIYVSSTLAGLAKQDAWISAALTAVLGIIFILMYSYLGSLYPDKTLTGIIVSVFGKWVGGFVTGAFVFLCLVDISQLTWFVGNYCQSQTMFETPVPIIHVVMIFTLVVALLYGIEAIARSSELCLVTISAMLLFTMLMVSPKIQADRLLPVLETGIAPVLKGSLLLLSYTTWPLIVLNMIYPTCAGMKNDKRKSLLTGYLWGSAIIFLCTIIAILVLGSTIAADSVFPTFMLAQEISGGIILSGMESLVSVVWFISLFFKALLYFYGGVISLSQLLGLKDHKRIVLPLGLLVYVFSIVVYPNSIYEAEWDTTTWVPLIASFGVVLPIALIVVSTMKRRGAYIGSKSERV